MVTLTSSAPSRPGLGEGAGTNPSGCSRPDMAPAIPETRGVVGLEGNVETGEISRKRRRVAIGELERVREAGCDHGARVPWCVMSLTVLNEGHMDQLPTINREMVG